MALLGAVAQRVVQAVHQQLAIWQLRQRVVESQMLDFPLRYLAPGDVTAHRHPVRKEETGLFGHRNDIDLHPEMAAIFFVGNDFRLHRLALMKCTADALQLGWLGQWPAQQHQR